MTVRIVVKRDEQPDDYEVVVITSHLNEDGTFSPTQEDILNAGDEKEFWIHSHQKFEIKETVEQGE